VVVATPILSLLRGEGCMLEFSYSAGLNRIFTQAQHTDFHPEALDCFVASLLAMTLGSVARVRRRATQRVRNDAGLLPAFSG